MNIRLPRCILLGAALLLLATAVPAPARVIELQRHENREFHFAFQYPASWQLSPVTGGDLRARVSAPDGGPTAQLVPRGIVRDRTRSLGRPDEFAQLEPGERRRAVGWCRGLPHPSSVSEM